MEKPTLGDRMKEYEAICDAVMMKRVPIVVRLDGKGFSKLTKNLKVEKPFDQRFLSAMASTMMTVASKVQGCVVGYTQSDEISFVLTNSQSPDAEPYFGNRILKIASITASMATAHFNRKLVELLECKDTEACFDARVFTVPTLMEATNALIWRQQDCVRNSISSATYYGLGKITGRKTAQKAMSGLNSAQLKELLLKEAKIDWEDYSLELKYGTITYKDQIEIDTPNGKAIRNKWTLAPAPIFQSAEGREWLLSLMETKKE